MPTQSTYSISQLAREFDLSTRTIRFYEEKGLLAPRRSPGGHRVYSRRDRTRVKLILRGKRFGHTLDEILDMLGPASEPMDETQQIRRSLAYGNRQLDQLHQTMTELQLMEGEILDMRTRLEKRLRELEAKGEIHV